MTGLLHAARAEGYAVAGLVVLGWEDAVAYVEAAEETGIPIILQAGPGCRKHTPIPVLGAMFRHLADQASVPIVCHIDHGQNVDDCFKGIEHGFTSVMFDGSQLSLQQNIDLTASVVEKANPAGVSVEGEVGFVGYDSGAASAATDPIEAGRFAQETGVDALAVSVGNVHLQTEKHAIIDFDAVRAIEVVTDVPLVLHGGSGIPSDVRCRLATETNVSKFNIGTELRMAFGNALRQTVISNPNQFDRIELLSSCIPPVRQATVEIISKLRHPGRN